MKTLNRTAQLAKDLADSRREREVHELKLVIESQNSRITNLNQANKAQCDLINDIANKVDVLRMARNGFIAAFVAVLVTGIPLSIALGQRLAKDYTPTTHQPPALQKLLVPTTAYMDERGVYRSYDNGEPLNPQPKEWKLK